MSYSFVNRPAVRTDIIEAIDYYKKINPEYPKQFLFRIREATYAIIHAYKNPTDYSRR